MILAEGKQRMTMCVDTTEEQKMKASSDDEKRKRTGKFERR